jgi:hypothetical protein
MNTRSRKVRHTCHRTVTTRRHATNIRHELNTIRHRPAHLSPKRFTNSGTPVTKSGITAGHGHNHQLIHSLVKSGTPVTKTKSNPRLNRHAHLSVTGMPVNAPRARIHARISRHAENPSHLSRTVTPATPGGPR